DLDLADDLITGRGLRIPYLRLLRNGAYLPSARFTHRTGTAAGTADGVADPDAVLRELRAGATIVLRGLIRYCPPLAAFCAELSSELGFAASAGAYLTLPPDPAARAHTTTRCRSSSARSTGSSTGACRNHRLRGRGSCPRQEPTTTPR
ncbi:MAG: hypothetical protein ACRDTC_08625, partial [Pseudonocardiaceae bacterium]